jgi:hypothetical protein
LLVTSRSGRMSGSVPRVAKKVWGYDFVGLTDEDFAKRLGTARADRRVADMISFKGSFLWTSQQSPVKDIWTGIRSGRSNRAAARLRYRSAMSFSRNPFLICSVSIVIRWLPAEDRGNST